MRLSRVSSVKLSNILQCIPIAPAGCIAKFNGCNNWMYCYLQRPQFGVNKLTVFQRLFTASRYDAAEILPVPVTIWYHANYLIPTLLVNQSAHARLNNMACIAINSYKQVRCYDIFELTPTYPQTDLAILKVHLNVRNFLARKSLPLKICCDY